MSFPTSRTATYNSILQRAVELSGRVYPPSTEESVMYRSHIKSALRRIWEALPWPDVIETTQEFFAQPYVSGELINLGDVRYSPLTGKCYVSCYANNPSGPVDSSGEITTVGDGDPLWIECVADPETISVGAWDSATQYTQGQVVQWAVNGDGAYYFAYGAPDIGVYPTQYEGIWTEYVPFRRRVSRLNTYGTYAAPGVTARADGYQIGDVIGAWTPDPRSTRTPVEVAWVNDLDDIIITDDVPYVWLQYKTNVPAMYDGTTPSAIPYRFAEFVIYRAAAAMLAVDGKLELADRYNAVASDALSEEALKFRQEEGQVNRTCVRSR